MLLDEFGPYRPKTRVVIKEDRDAVAAAVARRIMGQRLDLIKTYGVDKVIAAIDDVADYVGDTEEIGTSDVSAWVREVERSLQSMVPRESAETGVAEGFMSEIDIDLHALATRGDEEDLIAALEGDLGPGTADVLQNMMEELKDELAAKGMTDVINDHDKMIEILWDKIVDEYSEGDIETNESLRPGEHHRAEVTFDDGSKTTVKLPSDEGFRDQITQHFAKQGKTVKDIEVDWSIRSNESRSVTAEEVSKYLAEMKKSGYDI